MADTVETQDNLLMRQLAAGDEQAFLDFYRRHQGGVYRFALHMTGRPEFASDVVQETFLTLIRQAAKFDEQKGAAAAFLFGIARNHVRKLQEKESRYVGLPEEPGEGHGSGWKTIWGCPNGNGTRGNSVVEPENVHEEMERDEAVFLLREAVLTLPEHYREPITLCDLEGKSYEEAAALLDCPVGTVRSRLNRARSILLDRLRPARSKSKALRARLGGER
jgi:RNA polymerase sigma-70 factor (ECF subfamily)